MSELWKIVPETDGRYSVSSAGRVWSEYTNKFVAPSWQGKYLAFTIHKQGTRKTVRLHCAVLEAFVGPRPKGNVGAHLSGDRADCSLKNLAWVSPAENESHKIAHGTDANGEKSTHARFTNSEAEIIRKAYALGLTIVDLARITKVNHSTVHKIVCGRSYKPQPKDESAGCAATSPDLCPPPPCIGEGR